MNSNGNNSNNSLVRFGDVTYTGEQELSDKIRETIESSKEALKKNKDIIDTIRLQQTIKLQQKRNKRILDEIERSRVKVSNSLDTTTYSNGSKPRKRRRKKYIYLHG